MKKQQNTHLEPHVVEVALRRSLTKFVDSDEDNSWPALMMDSKKFTKEIFARMTNDDFCLRIFERLRRTL